ncbi:ISL3 family transposase [Mycolicibacter algericus DSM 45454]|uniref:ISL3 family transposase n=2 Tax=Mycolicibacter algericus TaxID=1288388 RepID=A0A7I9YAQ8_MYCAL|nr:ISL3 family transposase [Mycolicibacter algericus DSM 45454]GFG85593.1 ISL3 family transposase [Mycolicibacter algericus]
MSNGSSLLLGLKGMVVTGVSLDEDGTRVVTVGTAAEWVSRCTKCQDRSSKPALGWVTTRPRDITIGPDRPQLVWHKRKWLCTNTACEKKTFTEATEEVPPRARITTRAKTEMARAVLDDLRPVTAVATAYGCSWNTCHDAVAVTADEVLDTAPPVVRVLGMDETRRGKAKYETCPDTGKRVWIDRFDTGLVNITGSGGLLVQVNGRTAKAVTDWLAQRDLAWRAQITHVAIDMSNVYAKATREALPHARLIVDRFHLVKRGNQMVESVRRRITWQTRGRRGRKANPEWINRRRLLRGAERLTDDQRACLVAALDVADPAGDIFAAWIAKELLRDVLACTETGGMRYNITAALHRFYEFCTATTVPEIHELARTIETWQAPMILAITTGLSNARSEGYNRIVKHVGRIAFGFRNPANQRRRVRWACTRQSRQVPPRARQLNPC